MNHNSHQPTRPDSELRAEFVELWGRADAIWESHRTEPAFGSYVSSNYESVLSTLFDLRERGSTFLEWGSGLGVVTIMASRLGFDAYGIESELELIEYSHQLADIHAPRATFGHGSFIPDEFEWNPANGDESIATFIDVPAAYDELDMEIRDFDLVYAYPWPDENLLYRNIMNQFGSPSSLLLLYDVRQGIEVITV